MKTLGFVLLLCLPLVASAITRTWTNTAGQEIGAEFISVGEDTVKIKLLSNGKDYDYPINNLCEADKQFVEEQRKLQAEQEQREAEEREQAQSAEKRGKRNAKWTDDYEDALREAREYDLPVLLMFTGSDWCGYCMKMEANVFEKKEWDKFADKNLVLVKVDFPHGKKLKSSVQKQNDELQKKHGITGFPTLIMIDKQEKVLGEAQREYEDAGNFVNNCKILMERNGIKAVE